MSDRTARGRIAAALDVPTLDEALAFGRAVAPHVGVLKVGLELFVAYGPRAVTEVAAVGCDVFLDLKLCDIPETVARSVARARDLGATYLTVHASGGRSMLEAAAREAGPSLKLLGVTVLTSLSAADLKTLGIERSVDAHALALGALCEGAGVPGLVTSALEVAALRAALPRTILVTPGIRPAGGPSQDQARVASAFDAIRAGSDLLVVGRPLRDAEDRTRAAAALEEEVARALEGGRS